ncbi:hypothetical protein HYPSUDRAFT_209737 [Hypholoma sublateritium FD-334 SS-4]|uniref:Uncharacterized protein n=1 Tax=Hypholoma sublateritium (strain FD-334 SS-4) TaxID=945553 RepID=A0A0D2N972_HYPSF|nr:hypothetical protein HYPSUDRAFT_209737 [Hypholoma sublateritium FD-334 SS-4]
MPKVKNKPSRVEVVLVKRTVANNEQSSSQARPEHVVRASVGDLNAAETDSENEIDLNVFIAADTEKFIDAENSSQPVMPTRQFIGDNDYKFKPDSLFSNDSDNKSDVQSESDVSDKRLQEARQTYNKLAKSHRRKLQQYNHSKRLIASLRRENRRLLRETKVHVARLHDANAEISAQAIELKHKKVNNDILNASLEDTQAKLGRLQDGVAQFVAQFSEF